MARGRVSPGQRRAGRVQRRQLARQRHGHLVGRPATARDRCRRGDSRRSRVRSQTDAGGDRGLRRCRPSAMMPRDPCPSAACLLPGVIATGTAATAPHSATPVNSLVSDSLPSDSLPAAAIAGFAPAAMIVAEPARPSAPSVFARADGDPRYAVPASSSARSSAVAPSSRNRVSSLIVPAPRSRRSPGPRRARENRCVHGEAVTPPFPAESPPPRRFPRPSSPRTRATRTPPVTTPPSRFSTRSRSSRIRFWSVSASGVARCSTCSGTWSSATSRRRAAVRRAWAAWLNATRNRKLFSAPCRMSSRRRAATMNVRCTSSSISDSGVPEFRRTRATKST